ncbi:MAG: 16S rRNA (uracil(1498)-N(3))-methyltransferase [Campylobacter sp.]|nr:16S rRNA (uracil(1498)-N(3))-methyltransferase [Campylobacter sp.]
MVFLYSKFCGDEILNIDGEQLKHLKARRVKVGDRLDVRNLHDGYNYIYEILSFDRKSVNLELIFRSTVVDFISQITLAWAVVELSVVEKTLPSLNELGVKKLCLVYSEFSQKDVKINLERVNRILINSSQQCGRNSIMEVEIYENVDELCSKVGEVAIVDFGGESLNLATRNEVLFIGPEGGFSKDEKKRFKSYSLNSVSILRSNTAIIATASKMILF